MSEWPLNDCQASYNKEENILVFLSFINKSLIVGCDIVFSMNLVMNNKWYLKSC